MKVSEPIATYNTSYLQGLKNRLIASISVSKDEKALEGCLELLKAHDMPCVFSDEEFAKELRLSEESGIASDKEVEDMFAKWGL